MTKEKKEFEDSKKMQWALEHLQEAKVLYAISVLEGFKKDLPPIPGVDRAYDKKMKDLKSLIK